MHPPSEKRSIPVGVVGASGYSGAELVRLLIQHPWVDLRCVTSRGHVGEPLAEVFPRLRGIGAADELVFSSPDVSAMVASGIEAVFLALPHGLAAEFALPFLEAGVRVIDLSADFRLDDAALYEEFYGASHPRATVARGSSLRVPRDPSGRVGGSSDHCCSGMLSNEYSPPAGATSSRELARAGLDLYVQHERGQRSRKEGKYSIPFCRM